MREVELCTRAGEFVAVVEIPPFSDEGMPEVVAWGQRMFVRAGSHAGRARYEEALAVVSFTPSPGFARERTSPPPPVDMSARATTGGMDPDDPALREIDPATGQQRDYVILSDDERAKGFVRPVRRSYVHLKCGATTTMGVRLAETYARSPGFYSGTFCARCREHLPVGAGGEFVWAGTDEKVGT